MLKAEAEKLRAKVEEASLMAAKAVEEAEEKVQQLTHNDGIDEEEIEEMVIKKSIQNNKFKINSKMILLFIPD